LGKIGRRQTHRQYFWDSKRRISEEGNTPELKKMFGIYNYDFYGAFTSFTNTSETTGTDHRGGAKRTRKEEWLMDSQKKRGGGKRMPIPSEWENIVKVLTRKARSRV